MTGKVYMPLRSTSRETCVGSSDNVKVPIDEFSRAIDGALRIARYILIQFLYYLHHCNYIFPYHRQFDDGISECGLVCPKEILALDSRLDNFYTDEFRKGRSINTQFPCG